MTPSRVILAAVLIVGLLYCGCAIYRMGPAGILDPKWPRPLPYPDTMLSQYHNWLDARYPAAPGTFKSHGELYRVRMTLWALFATLTALLISLVPPALKRQKFQQDAPPNGGPATQLGGSDATEGPPSVS